MDETKVLLVGVDSYYDSDSAADAADFDYSMTELHELAKACCYEPAGVITQKLDRPLPTLYIGPGKVSEIKELADETGAEIVIFNDTLTPSQMRNLKDALDMPALDRTGLILDIFDTRAKTKEAKLQVETARLQYILPRLVGIHEALTRQGGTSGSMSSRGAGEKKIELDRRHIEHRLAELNKGLKQVVKDRETQRKRRMESGIPKVSLVGYTNAGKSTILNSFVNRYINDTDKNVFEADMLFATLDSATRHIIPDDGRDILLTDTVGFIHKLPTGLVKAFRSTLEESVNADLLLIVADCSDPHYPEHVEITKQTLNEIGAGAVPCIIVYNKADKADGVRYPRIKEGDGLSTPDRIYISAKEDESLDLLIKLITDTVYSGYREETFLFPYKDSGLASLFMENTHIISTQYKESGTLIRTRCPLSYIEKYKSYVIEE